MRLVYLYYFYFTCYMDKRHVDTLETISNESSLRAQGESVRTPGSKNKVKRRTRRMIVLVYMLCTFCILYYILYY